VVDSAGGATSVVVGTSLSSCSRATVTSVGEPDDEHPKSTAVAKAMLRGLESRPTLDEIEHDVAVGSSLPHTGPSLRLRKLESKDKLNFVLRFCLTWA